MDFGHDHSLQLFWVQMAYNEPTRLLFKGLYVFFSKKIFFIWMDFGKFVFATCYNKFL
jgi:hypothetical protein